MNGMVEKIIEKKKIEPCNIVNVKNFNLEILRLKNLIFLSLS